MKWLLFQIKKTDVDKEVATSLTSTNKERNRCTIANATVKSCCSSDAGTSRAEVLNLF